ncbi:MAG: hypothetical protein AB4042_08470 [Leptolyngbyaceae cyanobacterium]
MNPQSSNDRVSASTVETNHLDHSLFKLLPDCDNQQIKGGYWAQPSNQNSGGVDMSHRLSSHQENQINTVNSSAIAPVVPQINSNFSHHTAANRLDDLLLT